jgi:hypothetical protein
MKIDRFKIRPVEYGGYKDVTAEGPKREYLQWHKEQDLDSIWWTAKDASLDDFMGLVEELAGGDVEGLESAIRLNDQGPLELIPAADALAIAREHSDKVDFFNVDSRDEVYSLCWMSPTSPGRERNSYSPYGEVSLVIKQGNNSEVIVKSVEATATPQLGRSALRLVNELSDLAH